MLNKYECIQKLAAKRTDEVVISMMSLADPWARLSDGPLDYASVDSAMGHGADFAYGIAMAQPNRRVIALNGDGSMLMCLGSLVTMGQYPLTNFTLVIVENGTYEVTGNQPVPGFGRVDYAKIAQGAGIAEAKTLRSAREFDDALHDHFHAPGPAVFVWQVEQTSQPIPKPALPIKQRTERLIRALQAQSR